MRALERFLVFWHKHMAMLAIMIVLLFTVAGVTGVTVKWALTPPNPQVEMARLELKYVQARAEYIRNCIGATSTYNTTVQSVNNMCRETGLQIYPER